VAPFVLKPSPMRQKKSLVNLLLIAPAFVIMGMLSVGVVWLVQQTQSMRCPSATLLYGSGQVATIVQVIPVVLASIGFGLLAVNRLAHRIPPLRRFFDRDARQYGEPDYQRSQHRLTKFSFVVLALMLPISAVASFSQYCLFPQAVLYQPWPWTGLIRYSWQDVRTVETVCTRGSRGGWNGSFFLIMRDGVSFGIMVWPRSVARAYPEIVRALDGVDFAFDAERVRPGCDVPYAKLLVRRP
jgi:hypothetical protein